MIAEDDDLSLVPTPALTEELARRFDTFILLGQRVLNNATGEGEYGDYISGNYFACLGMIAAKYEEMILDNADEDQ